MLLYSITRTVMADNTEKKILMLGSCSLYYFSMKFDKDGILKSEIMI